MFGILFGSKFEQITKELNWLEVGASDFVKGLWLLYCSPSFNPLALGNETAEPYVFLGT